LWLAALLGVDALHQSSDGLAPSLVSVTTGPDPPPGVDTAPTPAPFPSRFAGTVDAATTRRTRSDPRLMPELTTRLADGWQRALRMLPLALVPLALALTDVGKIRSVVGFDGLHVGVRLGLPVSVVTPWQFVSVPQTGVNVDAGVPLDALPVAVVTVPLFLVVQAALTAGYFGAIADHLATGEYRFVDNAVAYFGPFLVLTALPVLLLLPFALGLFGLGVGGENAGALLPFVVLSVPVIVVAAYLFFVTPYLVVLRETGLVDAARGSYALAVSGGPYLAYAAGVAGFVLLVSPLATVLVVSVPLVGLLVWLPGGSVLGLALNVATMRFVSDVDETVPPLERWPDDHSADDSGIEDGDE
jgi:hypothetical protein